MPTVPFDRLWRGDPSRRMQWIVHHPWAYIVALVALDVPGEAHLFAPGSRLFAVLDAASAWLVAPVVLVAFWATVQHMRGFCDTCYTQPLGGPAQEERQRRWLWTYHYVVNTGRSFLLCAALFAPSLFFAPSPWAHASYSAMWMLMLTVMLVSERKHARLVQWCRWCRDDGGPDLVEPDVPVPTGQKAA